MKLLADLEVTTKAVERTAEAIGEDIAAREQAGDPAGRAVGSADGGGRSRFPSCMCKWMGPECRW